MTGKAKDGSDRGRPSKFKPSFCEAVIELGKQGKSLAQMCAHFDISRQTIDNWAEANPEFLEALSRAKVHAQAWWEEQGTQGMWADKFNAAVWKKSVEARFREDYTERQAHEHSGPGGGPIRTHQMTDDELAAIAAGSSAGTSAQAKSKG